MSVSHKSGAVGSAPLSASSPLQTLEDFRRIRGRLKKIWDKNDSSPFEVKKVYYDPDDPLYIIHQRGRLKDHPAEIFRQSVYLQHGCHAYGAVLGIPVAEAVDKGILQIGARNVDYVFCTRVVEGRSLDEILDDAKAHEAYKEKLCERGVLNDLRRLCVLQDSDTAAYNIIVSATSRMRLINLDFEYAFDTTVYPTIEELVLAKLPDVLKEYRRGSCKRPRTA